jgi:glyoxylase-like metal-dependent hydrolase (beta-lactamase superfamily II)
MLELNFRYEKVTDRVTRIFAFSSELLYLVEGENQAALLDSGSGIGFVRPLIRQLTDKPLVILLTHGHVDHAMGASEFPADSVYINQEDAYIYGPHSSYEFRKAGLFLMDNHGEGVTEEDFTRINPIERYHDLKEGDRFDLGGISIEMYACPGHTRGSLVMLIPEERMVLLGDACNGNTFVFEDYSTSIETYQQSLIALKQKLEGKYDIALASHGDGYAYKGILEENIAVCDSILQGTDAHIPMEFRGHKGLIAKENPLPGHGNIVYNPDFIWNK